MTTQENFDFGQLFADLSLSKDSYSSDDHDYVEGLVFESDSLASSASSFNQYIHRDPSPPHNEYEVRFRCTKDTYVLSEECLQTNDVINIGDLVIVETDSGFDAGIVHAINPQRTNPLSKYMPTPTLRRILCRGTMEHYKYLRENQGEENRAVMLCNYLAKQKRVPINVAAAEMQFDRKKLTIIYTSNERVDFRELVKNMYQEFRMRIWMQRVTPSEASYLVSTDVRPQPNAHVPLTGGTSARVTALNTERAVYMAAPAPSPRRHSYQNLPVATKENSQRKTARYMRSNSDGGSILHSGLTTSSAKGSIALPERVDPSILLSYEPASTSAYNLYTH